MMVKLIKQRASHLIPSNRHTTNAVRISKVIIFLISARFGGRIKQSKSVARQETCRPCRPGEIVQTLQANF